jgi:hypothetical protein
MNQRVAAVLAFSVLLPACSSPTEGGLHPGVGVFDLETLNGHPATGFVGATIGEDQDGSLIRIRGGRIQCGQDGHALERYLWSLWEGEVETGWGKVELVGTCRTGEETSVSFLFPSAGDTMTATLVTTGHCTVLRKRIPAWEVLRRAEGGTALPADPDVRDPMPEGVFREMLCNR